MYSVNTTQGKKIKLPGRDVILLIGSEKVKSDSMTLGVTEIPPMGSNGMHTHEDKEEIIYVLEGKGEAIVGESTEELLPNTAVLFPMGVPHVTNNLSDSPMKYVFIFNPVLDFEGYS